MKRIFLLVAALCAFSLTALAANPTASGTLTVSATVDSSISLSFENVANGVTLGGAATNAASLDFGTVSAYGSLPSNVNRGAVGTDYTVDTNFGVKVLASNVAVQNYKLDASIDTADAMTWAVDGKNLGTTASSISSTDPYGSAVSHKFSITIPTAQAAGTINRIVTFVATAN